MCYRHWLLSVTCDEEDDNAIESAAIEFESEELFVPSPVIKPVRPRRSLTLKRGRKLNFDGPEKVAGVEVLGDGSGTRKVKAVVAKEVSDEDSDEDSAETTSEGLENAVEGALDVADTVEEEASLSDSE